MILGSMEAAAKICCIISHRLAESVVPVRQHVAAKLLYTYEDFTKRISDVYFIRRGTLILPLSNNILQQIYF